MTVHTPVWMQPASGDPDVTYTGEELRQQIRGTLAGLAGAFDTQGVAETGSFAVTQHAAGANFSVDVGPGAAYVVGDDVAGQGTYFVWNDGTVNVTTPVAPATGTQVHRLVLQVQDKLANGVWTGYTAALTLLADTGSGTPAEPNSALTLRLISIAAGQASVLNANITSPPPVIGPVPVSYTPAFTGLTSLGTGFTVNGRYILRGKVCTCWASLIAGTGSTLGTGTIRASIPFVMATGAPDASAPGILRNSPNRWSPLTWWANSGTTAPTIFQAGSSGAGAGTVLDNPGNWSTPWASGDALVLGPLTYEVA